MIWTPKTRIILFFFNHTLRGFEWIGGRLCLGFTIPIHLTTVLFFELFYASPHTLSPRPPHQAISIYLGDLGVKWRWTWHNSWSKFISPRITLIELGASDVQPTWAESLILRKVIEGKSRKPCPCYESCRTNFGLAHDFSHVQAFGYVCLVFITCNRMRHIVLGVII